MSEEFLNEVKECPIEEIQPMAEQLTEAILSRPDSAEFVDKLIELGIECSAWCRRDL